LASIEPPYFIPKTVKADNDIPDWDFMGDKVKAVAATAALRIANKPVWSFSFNLTPEAEAKALRVPKRFLESLKRSFEKNRGGLVSHSTTGLRSTLRKAGSTSTARSVLCGSNMKP